MKFFKNAGLPRFLMNAAKTSKTSLTPHPRVTMHQIGQQASQNVAAARAAKNPFKKLKLRGDAKRQMGIGQDVSRMVR